MGQHRSGPMISGISPRVLSRCLLNEIHYYRIYALNVFLEYSRAQELLMRHEVIFKCRSPAAVVRKKYHYPF